MQLSMHDHYRLHIMSSKEFREEVDRGYHGNGLCAATVCIEPWLSGLLFQERHANRQTSPTDQRKIDADMKDERFKLNGQTIVCCDCPDRLHLINGQNRCGSGERTQKTFHSVIVWGVPFEAKETIDIGKKQSLADIFQAHKINDARTLAAAMRTYYKLTNKGMRSTTVVLPDSQGMMYYEEHKTMAYAVSVAQGVQRFLPPGMGTALYYAFTQQVKKEPEDRRLLPEAMFHDLKTGENLTRRNPVYHLRELLGKRRQEDPRLRQSFELEDYAEIAGQVILTWNALRCGVQLTIAALKGVRSKPFPEIL